MCNTFRSRAIQHEGKFCSKYWIPERAIEEDVVKPDFHKANFDHDNDQSKEICDKDDRSTT